MTVTHQTTTRTNGTSKIAAMPVIFGLRYLEEEATEIHDVIGCLRGVGSCTECDDED